MLNLIKIKLFISIVLSSLNFLILSTIPVDSINFFLVILSLLFYVICIHSFSHAYIFQLLAMILNIYVFLELFYLNYAFLFIKIFTLSLVAYDIFKTQKLLKCTLVIIFAYFFIISRNINELFYINYEIVICLLIILVLNSNLGLHFLCSIKKDIFKDEIMYNNFISYRNIKKLDLNYIYEIIQEDKNIKLLSNKHHELIAEFYISKGNATNIELAYSLERSESCTKNMFNQIFKQLEIQTRASLISYVDNLI